MNTAGKCQRPNCKAFSLRWRNNCQALTVVSTDIDCPFHKTKQQHTEQMLSAERHGHLITREGQYV